MGCGSVEMPTGGSRSGNWIRTVSRDFVFGSAGFSADAGAKGMRVVSFLGSFGGSVIEQTSLKKFDRKT
jgi:hypothetical protein